MRKTFARTIKNQRKRWPFIGPRVSKVMTIKYATEWCRRTWLSSAVRCCCCHWCRRLPGAGQSVHNGDVPCARLRPCSVERCAGFPSPRTGSAGSFVAQHRTLPSLIWLCRMQRPAVLLQDSPCVSLDATRASWGHRGYSQRFRPRRSSTETRTASSDRRWQLGVIGSAYSQSLPCWTLGDNSLALSRRTWSHRVQRFVIVDDSAALESVEGLQVSEADSTVVFTPKLQVTSIRSSRSSFLICRHHTQVVQVPNPLLHVKTGWQREQLDGGCRTSSGKSATTA